jgi:hypothetical protein
MDRFTRDGPYLASADWLRFPLANSRWGTVISHMAFSNHFRHHHHRRGDGYRDYAFRYMEILDSLAVGGSFHYAPGLPFIEGFLARDRFDVTVRDVAARGGPAAGTGSVDDFSLSHGAVRVTKLS